MYEKITQNGRSDQKHNHKKRKRNCRKKLCFNVIGKWSRMTHYGLQRGTRWRSWLRHCATNRKIAASIPDGVNGIFHLYNTSGQPMALGLTQPLTEMSTRNISLGGRADILTNVMCRLSGNLGVSTFRKPLGFSRLVMGLLYLTNYSKSSVRRQTQISKVSNTYRPITLLSSAITLLISLWMKRMISSWNFVPLSNYMWMGEQILIKLGIRKMQWNVTAPS